MRQNADLCGLQTLLPIKPKAYNFLVFTQSLAIYMRFI
jgi:hypothetical protein